MRSIKCWVPSTRYTISSQLGWIFLIYVFRGEVVRPCRSFVIFLSWFFKNSPMVMSVYFLLKYLPPCSSCPFYWVFLDLSKKYKIYIYRFDIVGLMFRICFIYISFLIRLLVRNLMGQLPQCNILWQNISSPHNICSKELLAYNKSSIWNFHYIIFYPMF